MKKIVNLTFARYLATLLAVVTGSLFILSLAGTFLASAVNVYDGNLDTAVKNGQKNLLSSYSRYIFHAMREQGEPDIIENSNMEYVIVKGINPNEDINSKKNKLVVSDKKNIIYSNNSSYLSGLSKNYVDEFKSIMIFSWNEAYYYYSTTLIQSFFDDGYQYIPYEIKDKSYSSIYVIFSNVTPNIEESDKEDLFAAQKNIITFLYNMRNIMVTVAIISAIVFLSMVIFACYNKYVSSDNDMVRKNIIHRLPLSIYVVIVGVVFVTDIYLGSLILSNISVEAGRFIVFICLFTALWLMSCFFLIMLFLLEICCRAGAQVLFKNTFLYYIYRFIKKIWDSIKDVFDKIDENIPLFTKTIAVLIALNVFMLLYLLLINGIYINSYSGYIVLLFFLTGTAICVALDFFVLKIVFQMESLHNHAKKLADGNLESKVDTSKMMKPFKKHGEYLNKVGEGMSAAVNEKIKSEHFKTELITNVSHDIKTPLTSIVNYVDLLKKENLPEPKAVEYIEVLVRQSARLKKLIEDLMEASKASTGNIAVELELCDINILLTQTLGEFEEKLNSKGLTLVIDKPEESVYIMADNRHIWRIFDNLMNNICKYGQPQTRVYINLISENNEAIIVFRNTSNYQLNISSEELLERFVRGDSSRHTEGSGLGLSIAQNLAELMGGSLKLHVDGDLFKVVLSFPKTDISQ